MFSFFVYFTFIFTRLWLITLKTLWTQSFVDVLKCSVKTGVLKKFANFICFTCFTCWSLFLIKLQALSSATFLATLQLRLTPTQVFCCETCEIFKNAYFEEQLRATASIRKTFANLREKHLRQSLVLKRLQAWRPALLLKANSPAQVISCEICKIFNDTAPMAASKILYRTTRFWKKRPIHFMKTKYTMLNFTNVTQ